MFRKNTEETVVENEIIVWYKKWMLLYHRESKYYLQATCFARDIDSPPGQVNRGR